MESCAPSVAFLCSPNNPTGVVDDEATVARRPRPGRGRRRPARGRRGLRAVRSVVGASAWWAGDVPLVVTPDLLQDVVDGRGPPRLPGRPGRGRRRARQGRAALPPRRPQAGRPDGWRSATGADDGRPGRPPRRGAGSAGRTPRPSCRSRCGRRAPTSCCSARPVATARPCGRSSSTARCWSATARRGRGWRAASGSRSARPARTTPSSPPSRRSCHERHPDRRVAGRRPSPAPPPRPRSPSSSTSTGAGRVEASTGIPFFDHMLSQLGRHGGLDLVGAGRRATSRSTPTTPSRTSASRSARRSGPRWGDKAGVRRFASNRVPLDEALVDVALDLSGRPYLHYEVDFPGEKILGDPPVRPAAGRGVLAGRSSPSAAITLHITLVRGRNTHHIVEATFKSVARSLRDAVRVEGGGRAVHQGRAVSGSAGRRARRWSRCSTTASATSARPRRRSSTSGPTPGSPPTTGSSPTPTRWCCPGWAPSGGAWRRSTARAWPPSPSRPPTSGRPFLGICVGMQLLYEGSDESPGVPGASGSCPARVRLLPDTVKRPQMQWNLLDVRRPSALFAAVDDPVWVYFVHSYAADPTRHRRHRHLRLRGPGRRGGRAGPAVGHPVPPREVGHAPAWRSSTGSSPPRPTGTLTGPTGEGPPMELYPGHRPPRRARACASTRVTTTARPSTTRTRWLQARAFADAGARGSTSSTSTPPAPGQPVNRDVIADDRPRGRRARPDRRRDPRRERGRRPLRGSGSPGSCSARPRSSSRPWSTAWPAAHPGGRRARRPGPGGRGAGLGEGVGPGPARGRRRVRRRGGARRWSSPRSAATAPSPGPDLEGLGEVLEATDLPVVASGGRRAPSTTCGPWPALEVGGRRLDGRDRGPGALRGIVRPPRRAARRPALNRGALLDRVPAHGRRRVERPLRHLRARLVRGAEPVPAPGGRGARTRAGPRPGVR